MLPSPADQIPKINGPLTGLRGWHDRPGTMERLRRARFIRLAHAEMMDQANIPATSRSKRSRIALPIDRKLTWPELVWQQIDIAQYIDQHA